MTHHYKQAIPLERITCPVIIERFMNLCETRNGLLYWRGSKANKGYGKFRYKGFLIGAHRIAWAIFKGDLPVDMDVHHTKECNFEHDCVDVRCLELMEKDLNQREANARRHGRTQVEEFDIPV